MTDDPRLEKEQALAGVDAILRLVEGGADQVKAASMPIFYRVKAEWWLKYFRTGCPYGVNDEAMWRWAQEQVSSDPDKWRKEADHLARIIAAWFRGFDNPENPC